MIHADAHQDKLGKAILPGYDLQRRTGCHAKSVDRSRGRLVKAGALIRITKGYEDQASEYAISEKFLLAHQVTDRLPLSRNKKKKGYQDVAPELPGSNTTDTDKLPDGYPILKNEQTNKRKDDEFVSKFQLKPKSAPTRINVERWQVVSGELPKDVLRCITPNSYSENLLDQAITNGYSPSHLRRHYGRMTWGNSHDIGGLFISELRKFAGIDKPGQDDSTPWCEEEGCDRETRTWSDPSMRSSGGRRTHNCLKCHPMESNERELWHLPPELKNFEENFGVLEDPTK